MKETNQNDKRNGQWQERKEQPKKEALEQKEKNGHEALVDSENERKNGRTQALLEKMNEKTNQYNVEEV